MPSLSPELKRLVSQSVALLGEVIQQELGEPAYREIESLRQKMANLRHTNLTETERVLSTELRTFMRLASGQAKKRTQLRHFAQAYTLMLELMNACESAYRSVKIKSRILTDLPASLKKGKADSIIYVLTAHPTEARSPESIRVFHEIQAELVRVLKNGRMTAQSKQTLKHWIQVAWNTPLVRARKPRVVDEAEHIYSTLLRPSTLKTLIDARQKLSPIYIRSWVGGDKDGHPGVDEKTFSESLQISRRLILEYAASRLTEVKSTTEAMGADALTRLVTDAQVALRAIHHIKGKTGSDGARVAKLRVSLRKLVRAYSAKIETLHPSLIQMRELARMFPAFVVPIELRESSDMLLSSPTGRGLAIARMLDKLAEISRGGDPRWYVRGFIIAMASSIEHLKLAAGLVQKRLGGIKIPIVPLFEQASALTLAPKIVGQMLSHPALKHALKTYWDGYLEVMVGYSDSSKESGVLPSRLKIAETMQALDHLCDKNHVVPLFFQGSGGSVDRGGGSIQEQTAWWPKGALRNYKVTLQGEMVERSLASPEIAFGQLSRIADSTAQWKTRKPHAARSAPALAHFASRVADQYQRKIKSEAFLRAVERATPYRFLNALKFGSRPAKRTTTLSVAGLRAIPWVLCWTQTRVLFPTWWGVGQAWKATSPIDRKKLRALYRTNPLLATYVRSLGFTLAKVELPVFKMYLDQSGLTQTEISELYLEFCTELKLATDFAKYLLGTKELLGWRPWLQESITLRSPMIHPLNLLQIVALKQKDFELLRLTATGISSGMMTTG